MIGKDNIYKDNIYLDYIMVLQTKSPQLSGLIKDSDTAYSKDNLPRPHLWAWKTYLIKLLYDNTIGIRL